MHKGAGLGVECHASADTDCSQRQRRYLCAVHAPAAAKSDCCAGAAPSEANAPSKEEFLQFGVEHGGDHDVLAAGLKSCREGTIKEITYKVQ